MRDISDELLYALNLPYPPSYCLRQDSSHTYKVPEFFGYESASTRWIIALLTNRANLKRLINSGKSYEHIFTRYYQIPDRPIELMGSDFSNELPAYHQQSILYLTPFALALYLKQVHAVETLLNLENESGRKIVHPAEPCFVQKCFKKGNTRVCNELHNTFPILIAIRRGNFEGVGMMIEKGFTPQKQFTILYRKSFRESVSLYRDILDYLVLLLKHKPGFNVTKVMKVILDTSLGMCTYDVFVYDIELDNDSVWDYVSIFRRICRIGYRSKYYVEESAIQILNILERIQAIGFFMGIEYLRVYYNGTFPLFLEKHLSKEVEDELKTDGISSVIDKIPLIMKATRDDLFQMDTNELKERINYDYQSCMGILILWFQRCIIQDRSNHYGKLCKLIAKILIDTNIIEDFFKNSDKELAETFSEWARSEVKHTTILNIRVRLQDYILFTDHVCISFINKYGKSPLTLLNAPMLKGKDPYNSPIIRYLRNIDRLTIEETLTGFNNVNQSNTSPLIINVLDTGSNFSINFIPANHAKNFTIDNNFETESRKHTRHHSMNNSRQDSIKESLNNANSMENLINFPTYERKNLLSPWLRSADAHSNMISSKLCLQDESVFDKTYTIYKVETTEVLFRPNIPLALRRKEVQKPIEKTVQKKSTSNPSSVVISDEELQRRVKFLLATNDKFREIKMTKNWEKVPFPSLRTNIQKYTSVEEMIKVIQAKESTQLDSLYMNMNAISMMEIMGNLSSNPIFTNTKINNGDFI